MSTGNAINLFLAGIPYYDGAGNFSVVTGTAGMILTSTGTSTAPTFQTNPGNGAIVTINVQTFTSSGTYTPTTGMSYCIIEGVGGGGPGVGVSGIGGQVQTGSGGGAACYVRSLFTAASIGSSQNIIIGSAGLGNSGVGVPGTATTVGSIFSAGGGPVGTSFGAITNTYYPSTIGSNIGSATGIGTIIIPGGSAAGQVTLAQFVSASPSGTGGNSYFGAGGAGTIAGNNNAVGYGAGGSGGANNGGGATAGGQGGPGFVIITEFIT